MNTAWEEATPEEKLKILENAKLYFDDKINEAKDEERNDIIADAVDEVANALKLYYTLEDPADLEKARNLWRAYAAIGLMTKRDWLYLSSRVRNMVAEVEAVERTVAESYRDEDAENAKKARRGEMRGKAPILKR